MCKDNGDTNNIYYVNTRGGTIHRCIDISRYFSRDTYRDIIFYNHDFLKRYRVISTWDFCKVIPQIHSHFVKISGEISVETN